MVKSGLCRKCILCVEKPQFNIFLASFFQEKMAFIKKTTTNKQKTKQYNSIYPCVAINILPRQYSLLQVTKGCKKQQLLVVATVPQDWGWSCIML